VCANRLEAAMNAADDLICEQIEQDVMRADPIETAMRHALDVIAGHRGKVDSRWATVGRMLKRSPCRCVEY
jgi:hypothetical protein